MNRNSIDLMDCQIDLVLSTLEFYLYNYKYFYPEKESKNKNDNLKVSLIRDTYEQISNQYIDSQKEKKIVKKIS